ncbi:PEGA domain-containing protein, partial [bacterium]|nr:PEGA domain-containing protein [bacterium]
MSHAMRTIGDCGSVRRVPAARWRRLAYAGAACLAIVAASPSCRHKPVYPDFGSAQLTSNPPGAEIIIDRQSTHRQTPCKIDGLAVGTHSLTLRKQWYRIARQSLTIKPGETRRQNANLQAVRHRIHNNRFDCSARDMAYDPVHERAYVATTSDGSCRAYEIRDTVAVPLFRIAIDAGQVKVAVSPAANRLFCALDDGRI